MSGGSEFLISFFAKFGKFLLQMVIFLARMVVSCWSSCKIVLWELRCSFRGGLLSLWWVFRKVLSCLQVLVGVWVLALEKICFIVDG